MGDIPLLDEENLKAYSGQPQRFLAPRRNRCGGSLVLDIFRKLSHPGSGRGLGHSSISSGIR